MINAALGTNTWQMGGTTEMVGMADGVITGAAFSDDGATLTITRSIGDNLEVNVPVTLRGSGSGGDLSGYGPPPQAVAANEGKQYTNLITAAVFVAVNRPLVTTTAQGTFADIDRDDFEYTESVERADGTIDLLRPPVLGRWLYDEHFEVFYNGVTVGPNRVEWISDTADDALAGSLDNQANSVRFYGHSSSDAEILALLHALPAASEVFYFNPDEGIISPLGQRDVRACGQRRCPLRLDADPRRRQAPGRHVQRGDRPGPRDASGPGR